METETEARVFHTERHDFDLDLVYTALKKCPLEGDDVDIREYLVAYNELCRFFKLTGRLFGFVAKDLERKIAVIEKKLNDENKGCHYATVNKMLQYELNEYVSLRDGVKSSGSRTLLRLHWALEFILEFMARLSKSTDHDKTSHIASEVYAHTLSKHHPWFTRQMAAIAMYLLPSRKDLINAMCKQDYETVLELLGKVVLAGKDVYNRVENSLDENNLLNIP